MYKLRELERKDLKEINSWRNNFEIVKYLGAPFRYINYEVDEKWFEDYMMLRKSNVRCAIIEEDKDEILGLVSLTSIDLLNQSAELQIMIGDVKNHNKGIGTFAVNGILHHAFNNLNLQRVELYVLCDNERAIHLYEKCGFSYEGKKRKSNYKNGQFVDLLIYSILKEEFINRQ